MSKKLLFMILLLATVAVVAVLCAWDAGIKSFVVGGLQGIGGAVWITASNSWAGFVSVVSTPVNLIIYTCILLISGGILFVVLNRAKSAGKIPYMKKTVTSSYPTGTATHSSTPMGATTRPNTETTPTNLATPPTPEETVKQEAT